MSLKNDNNKNLQVILLKQSYKYIKITIYSEKKYMLIVESDDEIIDQPISRKRTKKLIRRESFAVKIDKWTTPNIASFEARHIESLKPEVKVLTDMNIWYPDTFFDFTLAQFSDLIHNLKTSHVEYGGNPTAEYYEMLGIGHLRDKFIENFFEKQE